MADDDKKPSGPDLTQGIAVGRPRRRRHARRPCRRRGGAAGPRNGGKVFAIGAHCTHYHGPLADGLVVGDTDALPLASRLLRSAHRRGAGGAGAQPARLLGGRGARRHDRRRRQETSSRSRRSRPARAERIVIVGGGAAGFAAAEMLRRRGFAGSITMLSNDSAGPVDRPNLSKDYLAGSAPEDWVPLRGDDWYAENNDRRCG